VFSATCQWFLSDANVRAIKNSNSSDKELEFFTLTGNLASQRQQYTFPVDYELTLTQRIQHHWFRKLAVHPDC
jgi:hypothetical protein